MNAEKQQEKEKPVGGGTSYPENGIGETSDWKNLRWLAWIVLALVAVTVILIATS